jgi:hypothetical protein
MRSSSVVQAGNHATKVATFSLILFCAIHGEFLYGQTPEVPTAKFSLTISLFLPFGAPLPGQPYIRGLLVEETNTSDEPLEEGGCLERQGVFRVNVMFNGHHLKERDERVRKKREADDRAKPCKVPHPESVIKRGESLKHYIGISWDYPMSEPGTYEVTVSRESDLEHPDQSVIVTSNTLSIVVSEPNRTKAEDTLLPAEQEPQFSVSISAPQSVTVDSALEILIRITNTSNEPLRMAAGYHGSFPDGFKYIVRNEQGDLVPELGLVLTRVLPNGKIWQIPRPPGSSLIGLLRPGETWSTGARLTDKYRFEQPGKYTIQVSRQVEGIPIVYSNVVTLVVLAKQ